MVELAADRAVRVCRARNRRRANCWLVDGSKRQKAQEVTVATVQPLRVNLPLRGQRHVFTQVLQTEVNKPMTVECAARNLKAGGWLKPIALTFAAFLALWIAVAIFTPRREA